MPVNQRSLALGPLQHAAVSIIIFLKSRCDCQSVNSVVLAARDYVEENYYTADRVFSIK